MLFFGNESALLSWNRSALVSGTIELILKLFYVEISFVFGERKYFSRFFKICLVCLRTCATELYLARYKLKTLP